MAMAITMAKRRCGVFNAVPLWEKPEEISMERRRFFSATVAAARGLPGDGRRAL